MIVKKQLGPVFPAELVPLVADALRVFLRAEVYYILWLDAEKRIYVRVRIR